MAASIHNIEWVYVGD